MPAQKQQLVLLQLAHSRGHVDLWDESDRAPKAGLAYLAAFRRKVVELARASRSTAAPAEQCVRSG